MELIGTGILMVITIVISAVYFLISSAFRLWLRWDRFSWAAYIFGSFCCALILLMTLSTKLEGVLTYVPFVVLIGAILDYFLSPNTVESAGRPMIDAEQPLKS